MELTSSRPTGSSPNSRCQLTAECPRCSLNWVWLRNALFSRYQNGYSMTTAIRVMIRKTSPTRPRRRACSARFRPVPAGAGGVSVAVEAATYQPSPSSDRISRSCTRPTTIMITNRMIPYSAPVPNWPSENADW